jgi:DNA polymerase (family 10)
LDNWEVAAALERMAGLLALKGENSFKVRAYSQAARQIIRLPEPLADIIAGDRLEELPGIGSALSAKIRELAGSGKSTFLARLEEEISPELLTLFSIPGVGRKTAGKLVQQLQLENLEQLERAAQQGLLAGLPGMGPSLQQNVLDFFQRGDSEAEGFHRGIVLPLAGQLQDYLEQMPAVLRSLPAGAVRRGTETAARVIIAAVLREQPPEALVKPLLELPGISSIKQAGDDYHLETVVGVPVRLAFFNAVEYPVQLVRLTGSPEHWAQLQERAARRGFILENGALFKEGTRIYLRTEADLYSSLGLQFIPPELREGRGEIAAAAAGELPRLVELPHIRGDLHLHSEWSDGSAAIEEMRAAAEAKGYRYIAITDHSPSLKIAGGLSPERLLRQVELIRELNREKGCRILAGSEVDIHSDGSLDLPDEILEQLDLVIASVHSNFRQSRSEMTARICRAMEHPAVHLIGHPTGRLLGSRGPYRVEMERLLEKAAETGTALEINASPQRLDLSERYLGPARRKGVRLAVNTDAHSTATMADMIYGVTAARRGWLEPGDLLNTLPLAQLQEALSEKRRRVR